MENTPNTGEKFVEKSLFFTSLGCSKNLVDSEVMLGHLGLDGFKVSQSPEEAEVIIVTFTIECKSLRK